MKPGTFAALAGCAVQEHYQQLAEEIESLAGSVACLWRRPQCEAKAHVLVGLKSGLTLAEVRREFRRAATREEGWPVFDVAKIEPPVVQQPTPRSPPIGSLLGRRLGARK